ncbi:hypothetical protein [Oceanicella actignis]|uniref:hypothetical protein n=1 Tax=Oceanicella actignis TaxID=1189325 RepID=UPI0011E66B1F|nr:hypothetical protein [Oceanicella actignis]TYO89502.1 hypothetical protein LY05_01491 [Oceanicella actignis]
MTSRKDCGAPDARAIAAPAGAQTPGPAGIEAALRAAAGLRARKGRPAALALIEFTRAPMGGAPLALRDLRVSDIAAFIAEDVLALILPESDAPAAAVAALRVAQRLIDEDGAAAARLGVTEIRADDRSLSEAAARARTGLQATLEPCPARPSPLADPRDGAGAALVG